MNISAPRPFISPSTTLFPLDEDGAHFDAFTADTSEALSQILAAASEAGFQERANCVLALGAPSRTWGEAVAQAIAAVDNMGGGTVTISDTDVTLVANVGTGQASFDNIVGRLENSLPDAFALAATLPEPPQEKPQVEIPSFTATLSPEGEVQLRGGIPDEITNTVTENFAKAKFGQHNLTMGTRITEGLPTGWSVRVLAGIEALSQLSNGAVIVGPDTMQVRGNTGNEDASVAISGLLIAKLGQAADFDIKVTYMEQLDPVAAIPTPQDCIGKIRTVTESRKITFDPGSADLAAATQPVVDDIAEILQICGDLPIRVSGYTDSQGREIMNQQLSQDRADAVLTALRARRVPVSTFESIGFGEENPIADNDTEEGREANRRIEFSLIPRKPAPEETSMLDTLAQEASTAAADTSRGNDETRGAAASEDTVKDTGIAEDPPQADAAAADSE